MDLASVHHPGQYSLKLASDLASKIVVVVLVLPCGVHISPSGHSIPATGIESLPKRRQELRTVTSTTHSLGASLPGSGHVGGHLKEIKAVRAI